MENLIEGRTVRQLIRTSLRALGVISPGQDATVAEYDDALLMLRDLLRKLITDGTFGPLKQITTFEDYVTNGSCHVFKQNPQTSIILPELVAKDGQCSEGDYGLYITSQDGETVSYNRPLEGQNVAAPRDCTVVRITDTTSDATADWIYDGQTKTWQPLYKLGLDHECPLSRRDGEGLKAYLGLYLAAEFGMDPTSMMVQSAREFRSSLANRWDNPDDDQTRFTFY